MHIYATGSALFEIMRLLYLPAQDVGWVVLGIALSYCIERGFL